MSSQSMSRRGPVWAILPAMIALLCSFATPAVAQDAPPKWELYAGYSFFHPNTDVNGQLPNAILPIGSRLEPNPKGIGVSGTYNFNRWFGITLDSSNHWGSGETTLFNRLDDARFVNLSIGPKFTFRRTRYSVFIEGLVGDHRFTPEAFHRVDKLGAMVGGGLDVNLSHRVAWRVLRADFVMSNYRFGPTSTTVWPTNIRGARLQTGINLMFGGEPELPVSATCSAQPTEVFAGEPVTVTASGANFNPKRTMRYAWTGTGVKVSGSNASAQVDTTGLAPGSYTVASNLSDGSRHGVASCTTSFTVRQPSGPTITCSPNPATVVPGGSSTITSTAGSPDNRRLTYSYTASAGTISGNESSATLNTEGAAAGTSITVNCNVADDRNPPLTASATTTVTVEAPPPAPAPAPAAPAEASRINQIEFKRNSPRVDNTAKAILDDVALRLQRDADARAVLVGEADPAERNGKRLAAQRAANAKNYLVKEKGIDASRIETRTGSEAAQQTQIWLVPAGATFNSQGTDPTKP